MQQMTSPGEVKEKSRSRKKIAAITAFACLAGLITLIALFMLAQLVSSVKPFQVVGNAMAPTISDGDKIFVSKEIGEIKRGDIVAFYHPENPAYTLIMRVIALPDETIRIDASGQLYIDGHLLQELYVSAQSSHELDVVTEQIAKTNEYWVMGDNRDHSSDSRDWGTVPMELIYGKVVGRYWPLAQIGAIE
jgi:signal peptidase I